MNPGLRTVAVIAFCVATLTSCSQQPQCVGGQCVAAGAEDGCTPNPCVDAHRSVCSATSTGYICSCDLGFEPGVDGCQPLAVAKCSAEHKLPDDDAFEPDECGDEARWYDGVDVEEIHTLSSDHDEDWLRLPANRRVYEIRAAGVPQLAIDVMRENGEVVAADHRGVSPTLVRVRADEAYFVRVSAFRPLEQGTYRLAIRNLGQDDYGDDFAHATTVDPGGAFTGEVQFQNDLDVARVPIAAGHSYVLDIDAGVSSVMSLQRGTDGGVESLLRSGRFPLYSRAVWPWVLTASSSELHRYDGYDVHIVDLGPDDHADSPRDALFLSTDGGIASGQYERPDDIDVFHFDAIAQHAYEVTCRSYRPTEELGCTGYVADAYGADAGALPIYFRPTGYLADNTGAWSIYLANNDYSGFTVSVSDLGLDEGSDLPTAFPLSPGLSHSAAIGVDGDVDVYGLSVQQNHIYSVSCGGVQPGLVCHMELLAADGRVLLDNVNPSYVGLVLTAKSVSTGTWFLRVSGDGNRGRYSILFSDVAVDPVGDTEATASPLAADAGAVAGGFEIWNDVDVYSVELVAGRIYEASCVQANGMGCALSARNPQGAPVPYPYSQNNSGPSILNFPAWISGPHTIQLTPTWSHIGGYTFRLLDRGTDDHGNTLATATPITVDGGVVSGVVQYGGDSDVFSAELQNRRVYSARCVSSQNACQSLGLVLPDAGMGLFGGGSDDNRSIQFVARADLTHGLRVFSNNPNVVAYQLALDSIGSDSHGDGPADASPGTLGAPLSGAIDDAYDRDAFAVDVSGSALQLSSSDDVRVRVVGPDQVTQLYDGAPNSSVPVTTSGTHYVIVYLGASLTSYSVVAR